ncbi:MAG: ATP-binding protein [Actinomycetota bacterium]|nr:ATP-binding protein [Actinomycetota bacterium]
MASSTPLHLRFAAATAAVFATAGGALLLYVRQDEIQRAERAVAEHARFVEQSILRDELRPSDLRAPVGGTRRTQLDRLFARRVLIDGGLRVKLYGAPDGLVTYSNVHSLVGTKTDDLAEFRTVLGGRTMRDVAYLNHEGGSGKNVKALEVYVPLRLRGQAQAGGVLEIYQSYAPVAATVRSFLMPFAGLLLLALLGMWAALFPLVRGMARSLERSRAARQTAERALEETSEQLRQSQKMDAIGRLAGGVAHDFNNLLLAINGYAGLLSDALADERLKGFAVEIRSAGERAAALTHQLLAFSRRQVLQPRILNLNDAAREIESMLRRLIGEGVRVDFDLDPDLRDVEADPSQIGQVLLNLAVNARDAMNGSGKLTVSTRNDGREVVLEVQDTGEGMDEETQGRVFEPFFTTKDVGSGTGLGLSTVYGIVTQSGGAITIRSAPRLGSTFAIRLPAVEGERTVALAPEPEATRGAERILVVDDERVVRELLAQLLRDQGYDVSVAGSAREARALESSWDLLVTDVVMPETDGVELARQIDARDVLFISGYDQEALVRADSSFLQKPFSGDQLARTVRALLDRNRSKQPAAA